VGVHLVSQLLHQHFQLVELDVAAAKLQNNGDQYQRLNRIEGESKDIPSMVASNCLR
jgi:hypothetical protein